MFQIATTTKHSGPEDARYIQNLMYYSFRLIYNFNSLVSCPNYFHFFIFTGCL